MESQEDIYDISYSKKFKSFIIAGWTRFLTSRFFSLFYMIIFYRLIADQPKILVNMIVLTSGTTILSHSMTFGLKYSAKQKTLELQNFKSEILTTSSRFIVLISAPLTFIISVIYSTTIFSSYYLITSSNGFFELFWDIFIQYQAEITLYALYNSLSVIYVFMQSLEEAMLNVTKAYALMAGYSIINSISVPIFYIFGKSLAFILLAWNFAMICTMFIAFKDMGKIMISKGCSLHSFKDVLIFGFPSFLMVLLKTVGGEIDKLFIFSLVNPLELPDYYLTRRILTFGLEFALLFFSSLNVIFVRLKTTNFKRFGEVANSLFRMVPIATVFIFTFMTINSHTLGYILVGATYNIGGFLFVLVSLNLTMKRSTENFISLINALGLPKKTLYAEACRLITRICFIFPFVSLGVLGIVIALILSEFITAVLIFLFFRRKIHIPGKDYINTLVFLGMLFSIMIPSSITPLVGINQVLFNLIFLLITYIGFNIIKPLKKTEMQLLNQIVPQKLMKIFYKFTRYDLNDI